MSKRLAEEMCDAWTSRTGTTTLVLRPVMVLDDADLDVITEDKAELGAFVHVDDVADAVIHALEASAAGHHRLILCGPGDFDTSAARAVLGWSAKRTWPAST
jgi:nucleoside-diphosphate-sugar epimerase